MIITRYHNTETLQLTVEFLTPTFLGGADQHAELRAAPFKNLLRQWWRVAVGSKENGAKKMLKEEGKLFGSVLDDKQAAASKVRLTLAPQDSFTLSEQAFDFGTTVHPEVGTGTRVSNALYLGFGPIKQGGNKVNRYIAPGSKAILSLTFPKDRRDAIVEPLQYIDAFATIGSRSRNGWGSLALTGNGFTRKPERSFATVELAQLFDKDRSPQYPTSLAHDDRGILCWETEPYTNWEKAMKLFAETYMNLRTGINIKPQGLQKRHLLGYPVTHHPVNDWDRGGQQGRMPSQLRLMVKRDQDDRLVGRILHLPHRLPNPWEESLGKELDLWREIHAKLDANNQFRRCGGAQ